MLTHLRNRAWGPADKAIAGVLALVLLAGIGWVALRLLPEECGAGLERIDSQCIGVSDGGYVFDSDIRGLIASVRRENEEVRRLWEDRDDSQGRVPYVRIALMMPFTADETSTMTMALIRRSLAGAHAAQRRINAQDGSLNYQLLLANDGRDLKQWEPVVRQLDDMADDEAPLVAVIGFPSSTPETKAAVQELSKEEVGIPAIGTVLTSRTMSADRLFKLSPSNESFVRALQPHLEQNPGSGNGFLVWDKREGDEYAADLRKVFEEYFGDEYGLERRQGSYDGVIGKPDRIPRRFSEIAENICLTAADTVFYAGRDIDLSFLVKKLAAEPTCPGDRKIRIVKVGIGRSLLLTGDDITETMQNAGITLINASAVDPRWQRGEGDRPGRFPAFRQAFTELVNELGWSEQRRQRALDDGYAVMHHDAFQAVFQATETTYKESVEEHGSSAGWPALPKSTDIHGTFLNMSVLDTRDSTKACSNCVHGASGAFGFNTDPDIDHWSVCKPVPVNEYPEPESAAGRRPDQADEPPLYRTHQDIFGGRCP